ncbi:DUF1877 family protein [Micromonospora sp. NPDC000442]|uniref:DUF1877 family protein n=1 Tax=Micromonospora sp. NPDC000442 TaxID=3364217 RepID=UPI00369CEF14
MLGVLFAITPGQERSLLAAGDGGASDAVDGLIEEIEESWAEDGLRVDIDKAWDGIHRCLTDGTLEPDGGECPLSYAVLGGRRLHDEYVVVYLTVGEARDVSNSRTPIVICANKAPEKSFGWLTYRRSTRDGPGSVLPARSRRLVHSRRTTFPRANVRNRTPRTPSGACGDASAELLRPMGTTDRRSHVGQVGLKTIMLSEAVHTLTPSALSGEPHSVPGTWSTPPATPGLATAALSARIRVRAGRACPAPARRQVRPGRERRAWRRSG